MRSGLKIVTVIAFGVSLASIACSHKNSSSTELAAGDAKIAEMKALEQDMLVNDRIVLKPFVIDEHETDAGVASNGRDFKWVYMTLEARQAARARLEKYVRLADEAIRIAANSKKVVMVSQDALLRRRASAQSFLDSLAREEVLEKDSNWVADPSLRDRKPYEHSVDI